MKKILLFFMLVFGTIISLPTETRSQSIGIGTTTPNASSALDITHTTKGLLIPRMTTSSINAISNPAKGLIVYDSTTNQLMVNAGTPGSSNWKALGAGGGWLLGGNSGINPANQFIGNTDNQPLRFRINNIKAGELHPATGNIFWGIRSGQNNTTGYSNIAIGIDALKLNTNRNNVLAIGDSALFNNGNGALAGEAIGNTAIGSKSLFANTKGGLNTATGFFSLYSNTTGNSNTATGLSSLSGNTTGSNNTATGVESLLSNFSGANNTATGHQSLFNNNGSFNTAIGAGAMKLNVVGNRNTATGFQALRANVEGDDNTAMGYQSLYSNIIGYNNTGAGYQSLYSNTSGGNNTATGYQALYSNSNGVANTAVGFYSLYTNTGGVLNTAIGFQCLTATTNSSNNTAIGGNAARYFNLGYNNTIIGCQAAVNQDGLFNCVAVGESATCTGSNQVRLGNTSTTSIGGTVGYTTLSDGRYKKNIHEDVRGIDFIMKLRPVTYQLDILSLNQKLNIDKHNDEVSKKAIAEKEKIFFSGFIAQEVEQAAKDAGYDFSGVDKPTNENDLYGLRYAEFVVPLVKAFQEQQATIKTIQDQNEELKKINAAQMKLHADLIKRIEKLESSFNSEKK